MPCLGWSITRQGWSSFNLLSARKGEDAFLAFLEHLAEALPADEPALLVLDNVGYHKSHWLPTSSACSAIDSGPSPNSWHFAHHVGHGHPPGDVWVAVAGSQALRFLSRVMSVEVKKRS